MTRKIVDAVLKVRKGLGVLKKTDFNPHDSYNYVSIDTYYEKIAGKATEMGLLWRAREQTYEFMEMQGRSGSRTWVRVVFMYDLYVEDEAFPDYMKITVIAPVAGAQTTGQLYSYADKIFMRTAFAVPTGEKDADGNESEVVSRPRQSPFSAPPPPPDAGTVGDLLDDMPVGDHIAPGIDSIVTKDGEVIDMPEGTLEVAPSYAGGLPQVDPKKIENEGRAKLVVEIIKTFIPKVKTLSDLNDWHTENLAAFETVAKVAPEQRTEIRKLFTARKEAIQKEK